MFPSRRGQRTEGWLGSLGYMQGFAVVFVACLLVQEAAPSSTFAHGPQSYLRAQGWSLPTRSFFYAAFLIQKLTHSLHFVRVCQNLPRHPAQDSMDTQPVWARLQGAMGLCR